MARKPKLDTPRRQQFALRCLVSENLRRARLKPKVGLPLSLRAACKDMGWVVSAQALERIEKDGRLPRYRKALDMLPWIERRLGWTKDRPAGAAVKVRSGQEAQ